MENVVLVGVDGSPESLRAADWALAEASARHWQLLFANIFPPSATADPQIETAYLRAAQRAAELIFEQLHAAARALHVRSHAHVLAGRASDVLVQLSADTGLSVVGRRNRTGFTSRMGSVSSALAAHSHCPTAIVPHGWQPPASAAHNVPGPGESRFAGEVVAAVEPGGAAPAVMSAAVEMALRHGLPLNVVTVGPETGPDPALTDFLARIRRKHPKLQCSVHTLSGQPVHEIAEAARQSWLLVVGTRGIGGLTGMVRGSVSQALLQHVSSPVLVVPPGRA